MIHPALSKQAERWAVNKAPGWNNELEIAQHLQVKRNELMRTSYKRWDGGIMGYCEFSPTGNGRPANNPTALARYFQNEQSCLQVTQNLLFCSSGLRFLIIAPFYAWMSQLYSMTYSNLLSSVVSFYEYSFERSHTRRLYNLLFNLRGRTGIKLHSVAGVGDKIIFLLIYQLLYYYTLNHLKYMKSWQHEHERK